MLKLTRASIAIALGLMIGLSMFTSGAFAQSVSTSSVNGPVQTISAVHQINHKTRNHFNGSSRLINHYRPYRPQHIKCVRVVKYVRVHHVIRRVVTRSCRRW